MRTPYHIFTAAAAEAPDTTFLLLPKSARLPYAPEGLRVTYAEMAAQVETLRAQYAAAGYTRGHIAAIALDNRPEFFAHFLALNALGVAIQPINPDLRPEELAHQFAIAPPDLAVALPERKQAMLDGGLSPDAFDLNAPPAGDLEACALLFTSGSTGKPKCCVLSDEYFVRLAEWYVDQGDGAKMQRGEVILTPLPLFHMNALGCSALGAMLLRGTLVPTDRFSASKWWDVVAESGAGVVHYLGVMPAILLKLPETPPPNKVRFGFGAGVDPRHQTTFESRFGFPLIEAWAMTETGGAAVTTTALGDRHVARRCVGYPCDGLETRLVDDSGNDATEGELLVRRSGPDPRLGFFSCYLGNQTAMDEAWQGGWFHTGDIMRREGNALFFVDRKKNIVRRSGENIAVVDVEGALVNLPEVTAVAVAPVPDDIRGEEVMALIVAPDATPESARRIARASAASLAYHKIPGWIAFVESLPTTATQKLQRAEIRKLAESLLPTAHDLRDLKAELRKAVA